MSLLTLRSFLVAAFGSVSMAKAWSFPSSSSWSMPDTASGKVAESEPVSLPQVSGHTCCGMDDYGKRLLLFGGLLSDRTATDSVWLYDSESWTRADTRGDGPGPRMYASSARLGNSIFVVGGWDPEAKGSGGTFKDGVFSIHTETLEWTRHDPLPCGPVSRHTCCTVGKVIVIHTYKPGDDCVLVLHQDGTCRRQPTKGHVPVGISMCAAVALNDAQMLLYGGSTKTQDFSEFVYLLDTTTWHWTRLESRGEDIPKPRSSCSMVAIRSSDQTGCIVFGGAGIAAKGYQGGAGLVGYDETWSLRISAFKYADWQLIEKNQGNRPPARVAASLSPVEVASSSEENVLLLVGGWDPSTAKTFQQPWHLRLPQ